MDGDLPLFAQLRANLWSGHRLHIKTPLCDLLMVTNTIVETRGLHPCDIYALLSLFLSSILPSLSIEPKPPSDVLHGAIYLHYTLSWLRCVF